MDEDDAVRRVATRHTGPGQKRVPRVAALRHAVALAAVFAGLPAVGASPPDSALGTRSAVACALPDGRADWRLPTSLADTAPVASGCEDHDSSDAPARPSAPGQHPTGSPVATRARRALRPTLDPIPTHVVSAGLVVRLRVLARLDDGRSPRLTIDRLPDTASFDDNPDGSRTLRWTTDDADRGEHRFRITATHPDDATRASEADALIIVTGRDGGADVLPAADDVPRSEAYDPYTTYDDHPPHDPTADYDATYDPSSP